MDAWTMLDERSHEGEVVEVSVFSSIGSGGRL